MKKSPGRPVTGCEVKKDYGLSMYPSTRDKATKLQARLNMSSFNSLVQRLIEEAYDNEQ